jgi:RNA polymerase sigma-70 factor, ECF subfamily
VTEPAAEVPDPRLLVERAREGDRDAMDALVARYGGLVRSALTGSMGPDVRVRVDTDDLFQSTMTAALTDLAGFTWKDEPSFRAWLLTVARREALMAARFHRRQARSPKREDGPDAAFAAAGARTTPSMGAMRGEAARRLEEAVEALAADDQRVVRLHSFQGLSFPETARLAGLPDAEAARHVFRRALKRLGELMDERGEPA